MENSSLDAFELLSGTHLASGMSLEQAKVLAECGSVETFDEGQTVITWDDHSFDLLLLVTGKCEIRTSMNDVLYRLGSDSLIGEVSFLDHKPRSASALAMAPCTTVRFPANLVDDLGARRPDIAAKLLNNIGVVLCQKLRSTTRFAEASFV